MPSVFTLKSEGALSRLSEGFELCVFNLYDFFYIVAVKKKKALNRETKSNKTPEIYQHILISVSVVSQLVLIF